MENQYFKAFSFGFSYPNMARFNLKGKTILEIGFGYGREISQFCKLSNKVYGVDIAPSAVSIAMSKLKEINSPNMPNLQHYDGVNLPFQNDMFDFIYSCFVIQHMSKENAKLLISESLRVLNPEGMIFFEFFGSPDFLGGEGNNAISGCKDTGMFNNAFTESEIKKIVESCGGKVHEIENWTLSEGRSKFNNYWVSIKK